MHGFSKRVLLFVFWLDTSRQLSSHTKGQNSYDLPSSLQSSCRPLTCVWDHSYTCELIRMWVWVMSHSVIYVQKTHLHCQGFQVCSVNKFTSCNFRPIESNLLGYHGNVTSVRHKGVLSSFGKMVKRLKRPKSCDDRNMHSIDDGIKASECRLYSKNVTESGRKSKCKLGNKSVHTCESLRSSTEVNPNPPPPQRMCLHPSAPDLGHEGCWSRSQTSEPDPGQVASTRMAAVTPHTHWRGSLGSQIELMFFFWTHTVKRHQN